MLLPHAQQSSNTSNSSGSSSGNIQAVSISTPSITARKTANIHSDKPSMNNQYYPHPAVELRNHYPVEGNAFTPSSSYNESSTSTSASTSNNTASTGELIRAASVRDLDRLTVASREYFERVKLKMNISLILGSLTCCMLGFMSISAGESSAADWNKRASSVGPSDTYYARLAGSMGFSSFCFGVVAVFFTVCAVYISPLFHVNIDKKMLLHPYEVVDDRISVCSSTAIRSFSAGELNEEFRRSSNIISINNNNNRSSSSNNTTAVEKETDRGGGGWSIFSPAGESPSSPTKEAGSVELSQHTGTINNNRNNSVINRSYKSGDDSLFFEATDTIRDSLGSIGSGGTYASGGSNSSPGGKNIYLDRETISAIHASRNQQQQQQQQTSSNGSRSANGSNELSEAERKMAEKDLPGFSNIGI